MITRENKIYIKRYIEEEILNDSLDFIYIYQDPTNTDLVELYNNGQVNNLDNAYVCKYLYNNTYYTNILDYVSDVTLFESSDDYIVDTNGILLYFDGGNVGFVGWDLYE